MFALATVVPIADPQRASAFLVTHLGFERRAEPTGEGRLENGALVLRLRPGTAPDRLRLQVISNDMSADAARFAGLSGCWVGGLERQGSLLRTAVSLDCGIDLDLEQELTEDDLGILPPLDATLEWEEVADRALREWLRTVPLAFRADARGRATNAAETAALHNGSVVVTLAEAALGLLEATPAFGRDGVRQLLAESGVRLSTEPA